MKTKPALIIPTMRYRNAPYTIEWLCRAFGFEKRLVVRGESNAIAHAELTYGNAMIMLGSVKEDGYGKLIQPPSALNGLNTQAPYIIVEHINEHYKKAVQEGAEIVIDIKDEDYGGRSYTCRDKERHIWSFGSYNPWNETNGG